MAVVYIGLGIGIYIIFRTLLLPILRSPGYDEVHYVAPLCSGSRSGVLTKRQEGDVINSTPALVDLTRRSYVSRGLRWRGLERSLNLSPSDSPSREEVDSTSNEDGR